MKKIFILSLFFIASCVSHAQDVFSVSSTDGRDYLLATNEIIFIQKNSSGTPVIFYTERLNKIPVTQSMSELITDTECKLFFSLTEGDTTLVNPEQFYFTEGVGGQTEFYYFKNRRTIKIKSSLSLSYYETIVEDCRTSEGGGSVDTNMAEDNLTLNANRLHNLNGFDWRLKNGELGISVNQFNDQLLLHNYFDYIDFNTDYINLKRRQTELPELRFHDYTGSNYIGFKSPESLSDTTVYTLSEDGEVNQVQTTDGNGNLSWRNATIVVDSFPQIAGMTALVGQDIFSIREQAHYVVQADSIDGYVTDSVAVHPVSEGYAIIQPENSSVSVKAFGAYTDDGITDDERIQKTIDFCIKTGLCETIIFEAGQYDIEKGVVIAKQSGNEYGFVTLTLSGATKSYGIGSSNPTFLNMLSDTIFCIGIQKGRNILIENLLIESTYQYPSTIKDMVEYSESEWIGNSRGNRYSPSCAIVIDPFHSSVSEENRYYNFSSYYTNTSAEGTSMLTVDGCSFNKVLFGLVLSPSAQTSNGDNIVLKNGKFSKMKTLWVTGQTQSRSNRIDNIYTTGRLETIIDCAYVGSQKGTSPSIINSNLAGGTKRIFNMTDGTSGINIINTYIESLYSIGRSYILPVFITGSRLKFLKPDDHNIMAPPVHFDGGKIIIKGSSLEYFDNCGTKIPFVFKSSKNTTIEDTYIEGGLPIKYVSNTLFETLSNFKMDGVTMRCNANREIVSNSISDINYTNISSILLGSNQKIETYLGGDYATINTRDNSHFTAIVGNVTPFDFDTLNNTIKIIETNGILKEGDIITTNYTSHSEIFFYDIDFRSHCGYVDNINGDTVTLKGIPYGHPTSSFNAYLVRNEILSKGIIGDITTGSNIITNVIEPNIGLNVGDNIVLEYFDWGIPAGCYVVSKSGSNITMSCNAEQTRTQIPIYSALYDMKVSSRNFLIRPGILYPRGTVFTNAGYANSNYEIIEAIVEKAGIGGSTTPPVLTYRYSKQDSIEGTGSPSGVVTPDFTGQIYTDNTTAGSEVVYVSVGTSNTEWKQISN